MSDTRNAGAPPPSGAGSAFEFNEKEHGDASIGQLLRRLADQAAQLADQQARLLKAELRQAVTDAEMAAGAMAGAAVLGIAGLGVTLMGIAYLLGEAMPQWIATLIVGLATLAGAYAMYAASRSKLEARSMSVERSRRTIERAPAEISGNDEGESK